MRKQSLPVILRRDSVQTTNSNDKTNERSEQSDVFAIWQEIQLRIAAACARSGRETRSVTLLGAAKTVSTARLKAFVSAGLTDIGENYVQEGVAQKAALKTFDVHWHLIGALQSNKAKIAVREFTLVHSVDRITLAQALDKAAREAGKVQEVLLQINIGDEDTKAGCAPENLPELAQFCANLENVRVRGLMCLPPYNEDSEATRPYFRQLRLMRDDLKQQMKEKNWPGEQECEQLSMGMSDDFEVAIEEGATIIRLGTALFGHRAK